MLRSGDDRGFLGRRSKKTVNEQATAPQASTRLIEDLRLLDRLLSRANRDLDQSQRLLRETITEVQNEVRRQDDSADESQEGRHDH